MANKPEKPKFFVRDLAVLVVMICLLLAAYAYFSSIYIYVIAISLGILLPRLWFRRYYADLRAYRRSQDRLSEVSDDVNDNIARYIELQRTKNRNAR